MPPHWVGRPSGQYATPGVTEGIAKEPGNIRNRSKNHVDLLLDHRACELRGSTPLFLLGEKNTKTEQRSYREVSVLQRPSTTSRLPHQ